MLLRFALRGLLVRGTKHLVYCNYNDNTHAQIEEMIKDSFKLYGHFLDRVKYAN